MWRKRPTKRFPHKLLFCPALKELTGLFNKLKRLNNCGLYFVAYKYYILLSRFTECLHYYRTKSVELCLYFIRQVPFHYGTCECCRPVLFLHIPFSVSATFGIILFYGFISLLFKGIYMFLFNY